MATAPMRMHAQLAATAPELHAWLVRQLERGCTRVAMAAELGMTDPQVRALCRAYDLPHGIAGRRPHAPPPEPAPNLLPPLVAVELSRRLKRDHHDGTLGRHVIAERMRAVLDAEHAGDLAGAQAAWLDVAAAALHQAAASHIRCNELRPAEVTAA